MPDLAGLAEFVCRGLAPLPGAPETAVCVDGRLVGRSPGFSGDAEVDPHPACSPGERCGWEGRERIAALRIQTINQGFGCLLFRIAEPRLFEAYRPYLENTANVLAMTLENREQERKLRELNEDLCRQVGRAQEAEAALREAHQGLEQKVRERTLALAAEIHERRVAQEALGWEASLNASAADLARELMATSSFEEVAAAVLRCGRRHTGSAVGFVRSADAHGGRQAWAASGLERAGAPSEDWARGFLERFTEQSFFANAPAGFAGADSAEAPPVRRLLAASAMVGGSVVGQIALADAPRDYTVRDLELVGRLADLYALAVQRERQAEDRRALAEQVKRAQKLEAVGVLAGGIAHDFRNLLQIVLGYVDLLLLRWKEGAEGNRELQEIQHAATRGAELTQQLLAFSRKVEVRLRPCDLNEIVGEVARLLESTLPKMIRLELRPAEGLPPVNADSGQLEQVLLNLALNARDAMPEGGRLSISTELGAAPAGLAQDGPAGGPCVLLRVADTGHGMDQETAKRAFEPFFTTKGAGQGTGLGLSVAYGIAKSHHGELNVSSSPGAGTTFTLALPLAQPGVAQPAGGADAPAPEGHRSEGTVLMVDDEVSILQIAREVLGQDGYRVLTADSGEEALAVYRREAGRIGVVVLDLNMPGMGGQACLRELRRLDPHVKVIVASGYAATGRETPEETASGFLAKPYRLSSLLQAIRAATEGSRRA